MEDKIFHIAIPTDEGYLGNECSNELCKKYFKVDARNIKDKMHCPYCGEIAPKMELRTKDQEQYIHEAALEIARKVAFDTIDEVFGKSPRIKRGSGVTIKNYPIKYKEKKITPSYSESSVDTQLTCPTCKTNFQVYGIFGYCPSCRSENIIIYDTNIEIIKREFNASENKERALRHIYSDLVIAFETFCSKKYSSELNNKPNFQDLFEARKYFQKYLSIEIFHNLTDKELLNLRRVFQKRHLYIHSDGIINEKYIKKIPEDKNKLGVKAKLNYEEFNQAVNSLRKIIEVIISK